MVHVEVLGHRMPLGQLIWNIGAEVEDGAQGEPEVVDRRYPGIRIVFAQVHPAAIYRKSVQKSLRR